MGTMGAVIVSGVIGLIAAAIAIWGVLTQRVIARRRATIDYISGLQADEAVHAARGIFNKLVKEDGGLARHADDALKSPNANTEAIRLILNQYELVSIGVQRGILDLKIYELWYKQGLIRTWGHAAPFVFAIREKQNNTQLYYEFEQLVTWVRDTKPPKRSRWRGLFF